jgi:hypothetical protein
MWCLVKNYAGSSSRVLCIGDPQYAVSYHPEVFRSQIDFILANPPALVVCMGDCTDDNLASAWNFFAFQMGRLTSAGIKWVIATGNHDYESTVGVVGNNPNRNTGLNTALDAPPWIGGQYQSGHLENTWTLVNLAGVDWIVVSLEWSPRNAVVDWANSVLAAHPNTPCILITHAFMANDWTRFDWALKGTSQEGNPHQSNFITTPAEGINDGQELWIKLVNVNSSIRLVLSGHVTTAVWRNDAREDNTRCVQILADYQSEGVGGDGWLVDYDIDLANQIVTARTLSPYLRTTRYFVVDLFREPLV